MKSMFEDSGDGKDLVVVGPGGNAEREAILGGLADGLILNYARGFTGDNLEFIRDLPVKRMRIIARTITDASPIYSLAPTLRVLSIQIASSVSIDLSLIPDLRVLSAPWPQVSASVPAASALENAVFLSYSDIDLEPLGELVNLRTVSFKDRAALTTISGVQNLDSLVELGIHGGPALVSIEALLSVTNGALSVLRFEGCKGISSLAPIAHLHNLKFFEFSESGSVETIRPLSCLTELEKLYLYGSTRILDNDISVLAELQNLRSLKIQSRGSYRPSVAEIQRMIRSRTA